MVNGDINITQNLLLKLSLRQQKKLIKLGNRLSEEDEEKY